MVIQKNDNGSAWPAARRGLRESASDAVNRQIHLAFVEDDDAYREVMTGELAHQGFAIEAFGDSPALLASLTAGSAAEIILLDWNLPGVSGIDLLPKLRGAGISLPVVFLTGRSQPLDEKLAFDGGAVDFVNKARGAQVLARRLRLVADSARKPERVFADKFHCGKLLLKSRESRAYWGNSDLNLTLTEFKIVHLLASNVGDYVTYRAIYDRMHYVGFIAGSSQDGHRTNVRSCIKRIRNKIRAVDPDFDGIENFQAFGYRWREA